MDEDVLRGMLWGAAIGDALGTPHEFRTGTPLRRYSGLLEFPAVRQNRWQGRRVGVVGQVSDDTEMGLALAAALVAGQRYDPDRAVGAYLVWANSKCPFMGRNTRALLHGVKTLRGYRGRYQKVYGGGRPQDEFTQSNGCLMRCAPLAALGAAAGEAARADCALTNPHPTCVDACQVYIRAAQELGAGAALEVVVAAAPGWAETPAVQGVLEAAGRTEIERNVTGESKGWVLHALWCAFRALLVLGRDGSYEAAIDWVIRCSGDTDTNACIAGALLGACLGYEALESEERTGANIAIARAADPNQGALKRPERYHAARIDHVARGLAAIAA